MLLIRGTLAETAYTVGHDQQTHSPHAGASLQQIVGDLQQRRAGVRKLERY